MIEPGKRQPSRRSNSVDRLDDFDLAREDCEKRPLAALGDCKFAGRKMNVGRGLFELVQLFARQ